MRAGQGGAIVSTTAQILMVGLMLAAGSDGVVAETLSVPTTGEPVRLAVRLSTDQGGGLSALQLRLAIDEVREIWKDVGVSGASGHYGELSRPDEATISLRILRSPG